MFGWFRPWNAAALLVALVLLLAQPSSTGAAGQDQDDIMLGSEVDMGKPISLDVQDAEIGTVMRSLASFSGVNIVTSPRVEGKVTVKLENVPWREALEVILRAHSFDYVEEHGIIRVDTAEELRKEEVEAKRVAKQVEDLERLEMGLVVLNYANADEVRMALEQMLTKRGMIDVDARTNTLLINDIPDQVAILKEMAENLDTMTPQVEINARLLDMDARATRELGISWSIDNIKDVSTNVVGSMSVDQAIQNPVGDLKVGSVQSWGDLMFTLEALERDNLAHIIANPIVTTTDNREASMLVGQKIPLIVADEAGNAITQLTTVGVLLKVTPHINDDTRITLDIHNEVSDLSSQATVQGGVIINTTEADTRVLVDNGETAVIGGLIRNVESTLNTGIPVLKDIPLLGLLFRSQSKTTADRELVIFLTPRIVTDEYLHRDVLSYEKSTIQEEWDME
jgi:type IV pilus assembly protein PilQ